MISGFLGSGKTTLLNLLLLDAARGRGNAQAPARTVVLINELGDVGLDHERVMHLDDHIVLLESGCICCAVRGDLVNAMRQLFLDALYKKIPPFSALVIETTGIADPAPIMYTLQYERFLADRYAYAGCVTVVDGQHGLQQLLRHPEAAQQAVLADALVISKADLAAEADIAVLRRELERLNPAGEQYLMQSLPGLDTLLRTVADCQGVLRRPAAGGVWSGPASGRGRSPHTGVGVLTMRWPRPWARAAFTRALSDLLASTGTGLLRMKGRVRFCGEPHVYSLHAVHQQLYPIEPMVPPVSASPGRGRRTDGAVNAGIEDEGCVLVLIHRGLEEDALLHQIQTLLPGGTRALSSDGNFIQ